jgi:hypothetical protein
MQGENKGRQSRGSRYSVGGLEEEEGIIGSRASADMLYSLLTCFSASLVGMEEGIIAQSVCDRGMCRKKESTRSTA